MTRKGVLALLLATGPITALQSTSVEGRVVNAAGEAPLRKVNLTLSPTRGKAKPATAQTDQDGRFVFRNVAPGGYRLSGERPGFPRQDHKALLLVEAGKPFEDITFRMAPGAVISGRVIDQEGEPMPSLVVSALRKRYEHGKLDWRPAGSAQTNDRGEFRISNLRAGRYLLSATDLNIGIDLAGMSRNPLPGKPEAAYASTYHGNTTDLDRAVPVEVREGEDRRGTDIQMVRTSTVRVRGKVVGALEGRVLVLTVVRKGAAPGVGSGGVALVQPNEGTFELKGLTPGSYLLIARSVTDGVRASGAPVPLEIGDQHIDGFEMPLAEAGGVSGTVTLAGRPAAAAVRLERLDFQVPDAPEGKAGGDGAFTLPGVPVGRYRVMARELPDNVCLQGIRFAGAGIDPDAADLQPGGKLEILLGPGAQVEGTVTGADDQPVSGATVALIPASRRESHYASGVTDPDGTFVLKGVAPGRYQALAWETLEPGAFLDSEFVKPFAARAQALEVEANGRTRLALKTTAVKDR